MLVVVELCGISSVVVWSELSAPTSSINIIIITANYMYVLYVVILSNIYIAIHVHVRVHVHVHDPCTCIFNSGRLRDLFRQMLSL